MRDDLTTPKQRPTVASVAQDLDEVRAVLERLDQKDPARPSTSLASKWAGILGQLEVVTRNGFAEVKTKTGGEYSYRYVLESDLMEGLRPALADHGIAVFYSDEILDLKPVGDRGQMLAVVRVRLELVDADTDEHLTVQADDFAFDYGDKAARKAKTGAMRYLLLKGTLNPSDAHDDPDAEVSYMESDARPEPPTPRTAAPRPRAATSSDREPRDIRLRRTIVERANEVDEVSAQPPGSTLSSIVAELGHDLDATQDDKRLLNDDALVELGTALSAHLTTVRQQKHDGDVVEPFKVPDLTDVPFG